MPTEAARFEMTLLSAGLEAVVAHRVERLLGDFHRLPRSAAGRWMANSSPPEAEQLGR